MINGKNILNQNNEKLFVETYIPTNIKSTIVFCHGITGCRKGRTKNDNYFQDMEIAKNMIMMFVYQKIQKN